MGDARATAELLLQKAREDLRILEGVINDRELSIDGLAFHAQQAVEKSIKSVLIVIAGDFPKTHDLLELIDLLSDQGVSIPAALENADWLTPFATVFRYTGSATDDTSSLTRDDLLTMARAAVEWAGEKVG